MFELKLADNDVTGGSIPVTWCVDQELLKKLAEQNVRDPYVVIVVAPDSKTYHSSKEVRKVVPLKDLMTYVDFRVPGKNKIFAFVSPRGAKAKSYYLSRENSAYNTDILTHDGTDFLWQVQKDLGTTEPLLIDVPAGLFAKEPSALEKSWVNHFFRSKSPDQCSFRRRRMFAYTVQPFIIFFQWLARLAVTLVALLFGARNISAEPLLHPLTTDFDECLKMFLGGTVFIRHLPEDDNSDSVEGLLSVFSYGIRSFWSLPFMPLLLIPIAAMVYFNPIVASTVALTVLGIILLAGFVIGLATGTGSFIVDWFWSLLPARKEDDSELWYLTEEDLICSTDKKAWSFKTLPSNKKSIRLRFMNLKSKVCRPFSA